MVGFGEIKTSYDPIKAANPMEFIPEIMGVLSRAITVFWCCFNRFFADFNPLCTSEFADFNWH
jgi:hypothetical protein